jgi:hypothetical protein
MLKHAKSGLSTPLDEIAEPVPVPDAPLAIVRESPESLRRKFEARLFGMRDEANQNSAAAVLADCLTWQLALYIVHYGAVSCSHILKSLGLHVAEIHEYETAQADANAAKKRGAQTH